MIERAEAELNMAYVIALYRVDRRCGGPEEGGWWYYAGDLERIIGIRSDEDRADRLAFRLNMLLARLQKHRPQLSSILCDHSRFQARVHKHTAPPFFPETRPHYE